MIGDLAIGLVHEDKLVGQRYNMTSYFTMKNGHSPSASGWKKDILTNHLTALINAKYLVYSFKGISHQYEGFCAISNLSSINENEIYQDVKQWQKSYPYVQEIRADDRKSYDKAGLLNNEITGGCVLYVYEV